MKGEQKCAAESENFRGRTVGKEKRTHFRSTRVALHYHFYSLRFVAGLTIPFQTHPLCLFVFGRVFSELFPLIERGRSPLEGDELSRLSSRRSSFKLQTLVNGSSKVDVYA